MKKPLLLLCAVVMFVSDLAHGQRWKRQRYEVSAGVGISNFLGELGGANQIGTHYFKDLEWSQTRLALAVGLLEQHGPVARRQRLGQLDAEEVPLNEAQSILGTLLAEVGDLQQSAQQLRQVLALVVGRNNDQRPHVGSPRKSSATTAGRGSLLVTAFLSGLRWVVWLGPDTIPGRSRGG